jgi:hypothetical protein
LVTGNGDRDISLQAAAQRQQFGRGCALSAIQIASIDNPMEHSMRRLLMATTLGLGLLSGGGMMASAFARPAVVDYSATHTSDRPVATPVHDDYRRPHYAPPPRHWHRPVPIQHDHSSSHRYDEDRYSWR